MRKPSVAIVRGKFLNAFEMQSFEPLANRYNITAFGSLTPFHDHFAFPVVKLPSPMDLPDFPYKMPILNRLFIDAQYLWGLENRLKGFDIVHTAETYYHYTRQCLNAKGKAKVVATVLENIPYNNEGIWGRKAFKKRAREELDHIIALSQKTKDALIVEGCNPKKITVIGFGIDTKRFIPKKRKSKELTILFCGRPVEEKGINDLTNACQILKNEGLSYRLELVSNHPYDDMPRIYQQADIFVAPSKPTKTWEEQYGMVLLEAMACGLPIITTRTGAIPEVVGDTAQLIEPGDAKLLASSLKSFLINAKKRESFGKKARIRAVSQFDIHLIAKKLDNVYQMVQ